MPVVLLALQLGLIVVAARGFGALFQLIRQPAVVGEMVAGIVLGPSVFGHLFPDLHARLFPHESREALTLVAQVGVLTFMFVVGTRVELDVFRRHTRMIAAIAAAGIAIPFVFGGALGFLLHDAFATSIPRVPFVVFIATAMSVTAFPVLARIIVERRLERTLPGNTALVCAAINDLVAWILVGSVVGLLGTGKTPVSLAVHGVFLAFSAGIACAVFFPRVAASAGRVEAPASRVLLPVFFALTGLRTDLRLLAAGGASWLWCLVIIAVATLGKMGGTMIAAVASGMPRAQAFTLGALMNTRGLMELVVLNIGYELGLLPPELFAMMVVMTLATTCATGPLVDWSAKREQA